MKDLIWGAVITIAMGTYAGLTCWLVAEKRKNRHLRKMERARGLLRLADKPYMMPKQGQDHEIEIIKHPTQRELKVRERVNTSHENGGKGGNHDS